MYASILPLQEHEGICLFVNWSSFIIQKLVEILKLKENNNDRNI